MTKLRSWGAAFGMRALMTLLLVTQGLVSAARAQGPDAPDAPAPETSTAAGEDGETSTPTGEDGETAAENDALVPPELIEFVRAELVPEEARSVTLALVVNVDGSVGEVSVTESAGEPYDSAARTAASAFRFRPATRGGEPISVRIGFRYTFEPPPPPQPPALGALEVRVRRDGATIESASVLLMNGAGATLGEQSVESGNARFADLEPGAYRVLVFADGFVDYESEETVVAGEETVATYRLALVDDEEEAETAYGATAVVDPPPREVTRRTIRREELTRVAGTRGDALRTIELLPGVARPPSGLGVLLIRGSAPNDSQTFLEGNPVPLLYHFGGLTGFYNSRMLERIDFYPGNFSVRYGRATGGVVDVGTRDPAEDRFHGVIDVNLIDASALVEGPITDRFSFGVAARRSYVDAFFGLIPFGDDIDPVAAPVYWDYQVQASYRPSSRDRIRFRAYGSSDRFELAFAEPVADGDPGLVGDIELVTWFHRFEVDWRHRFSDAVEQTLSVSTGPTHLEFEIGQNADFDNTQIETQIRNEWTFRLRDNLRARAGLDWYLSRFQIRFTGLNPGTEEGNPESGPNGAQSGSAQDTVFVDASVLYNRPALYFELDYEPADWLRIVPGIRVDHFSVTDDWTADPRVAAIFSARDTRVKVGAGLFTQAPQPNETSADIGNPDLDPIRAFHLSAGVEHSFDAGIRIGVEGFYKHLYDRVVQTETGVDPVFSNDGTGRVYGVELSGRIEPRNRPVFGFLSYTLSRSERNDRDDPTRLFDFDQTHILNMALGWRLPRGWEVSGTFRLASGNPSTPILRGVYDAANDVYVPVIGPTNSQRDDYFHRLDLRVEKKWRFDSWALAFYVDVQNVYNRRNQEGLQFNYDFTQVQTVSGLPILPSLGLRGEL